MATRITERDYEIGAELIKEGTSGNSACFIVSGQREVRLQTGGNSMRLAFLQAGDFFGELSILDPAPRRATVGATEAVRVMILEAPEFETALKQK